jgi:hypothetical protein
VVAPTPQAVSSVPAWHVPLVSQQPLQATLPQLPLGAPPPSVSVVPPPSVSVVPPPLALMVTVPSVSVVPPLPLLAL